MQGGEMSVTLNAVLIINALVMYLLILFSVFVQGSKSTKAGSRAKEDAFMSKGYNATEDDKSAEIRWKKIIANTLETCPIGFIIFAIAVYVSHETESRYGLIVVISVFVFCRLLYIICYAYALQPWRSLVWASSILCIITAGLIAVIDSFKNLDKNIYNSSNILN